MKEKVHFQFTFKLVHLTIEILAFIAYLVTICDEDGCSFGDLGHWLLR